MDEPTASLDAVTEHALFEQFSRATSRAGSTAGAITVLVSHRFSTVSVADLIVVLEDGHVVESELPELTRLGGAYSQLYEMPGRTRIDSSEELWFGRGPDDRDRYVDRTARRCRTMTGAVQCLEGGAGSWGTAAPALNSGRRSPHCRCPGSTSPA